MTALAAITSVAAGVLVLFGWAQGIEVLKRIQPGLTPMNPLTACCFILSGIAIALVLHEARIASRAIGVLIATIACLKLADLSFFHLPVDRILFSEKLLLEAGPTPNRMAPNTAVALTFVGLSLLFASSRRSRRGAASQAFGIAVLLISMFALIGYGFGITGLHSVGPFIPMAVHTAVLLLILSFALLSLNPESGLVLVLRDRGPAGAMARTTLPLAMAVPVAVGLVRLWGQEQGYYGTETGVALQVVANVLVTSALLVSAIFALHGSDRVRKRREQSLARSEDHYRLAEAVANVGHWRLELPGRRLRWSDELFRITGRPRDSGAPGPLAFLRLFHTEDRNRVVQSLRDAIRHGRNWQIGLRLLRSDGQLRDFRSQGVCELDDHGNVTGIFGVFADVTELESARRAAEAATATKASFLANMSHEIRTPMNGVLGFTELLLAGDLSEEQRQRAEIIADSGRAMMRLLNDILDLSKVEAGQMKVAAEPFDLQHALKACMKLVAPALMRKGLEARCEIAPDVPKMVSGDGLRLRQIVLNLMGNAAKFTNLGSVTLRASVGANAEIIIEIVDTGIGIAPERQAAVFEQFVQANTGIAPRFGGSGLGLTISVQLAELMGGALRLTSEPGVGTTFILTVPLPAVASTAALAPPGPLQHSRDDGEACSAARVLVAEDHDVNRLLMSDMLGRLGYQVDLAEDGIVAVSMVQSASSDGDPYSIVLMDMHMPRMDGLEATQVIRAKGFDPARLPIVALTANAYADDVAACLAAGMQAHLFKPVTLADLDAAVRLWGVKSVALPLAQGAPLPSSSVRERYRTRRAEALSALDEMVRTGRFEEAELADVADMMHKLAGTAGMFGEAALGEAAHFLEEGLASWPAEGRPERIRQAVEDIARAA